MAVTAAVAVPPDAGTMGGVADDEDWRRDGACAYRGDPDDWHMTDRRDAAARAATGRAKALCRTCPVRVECLDTAMTEGLLGVWGGLTDKERRTLARERRRTRRERGAP